MSRTGVWGVIAGQRVQHYFAPANVEEGEWVVVPHSRWPRGNNSHWVHEADVQGSRLPRCKRCAHRVGRTDEGSVTT